MKPIFAEQETPALNDLRTIRTREALRGALLTLLEKKPLEQIVIRDITTAARVGYATFYRHYPTKEALLHDLAREEVDRLVGMTLPVADSMNTLAACTTLCSYVFERRALWTPLLTGGAAGAIRQEFLAVAREIAATRSEPASWLPSELGVILVVTSHVELLAWWLRQPEPLPVDQVARILDRAVVSPSFRRR